MVTVCFDQLVNLEASADDALDGEAPTSARPAGHGAPKPKRNVRRLMLQLLGVLAVIAVVVLLWNRGQDLINGETSGTGVYLTVIALVFGDAVCPVLPGESTLNAAIILSSEGDLSFWLIVLSGAIGAIVGDSTLYWLSRKSTGRIRTWMDRAADAKAGATVVKMLDRYGNIFLLFGRYVPGLRFALNVTLGGVVKMPYRRFLFWSALSGSFWSLWICTSAYYISALLAGYPVAAFLIATFAGTFLIGFFVWVQSRINRHRAATAT